MKHHYDELFLCNAETPQLGVKTIYWRHRKRSIDSVQNIFIEMKNNHLYWETIH